MRDLRFFAPRGASLPPVGIAAYEDGARTYYTLDDWNGLAVKPTVVGVFIASSGVKIIIHPEFRPYANRTKWIDSNNPVVPGITVLGAGQTNNDKDGRGNTAAMLTAISNGTVTGAPAFTWAASLSFADGSTPYFPAAGEVEQIRLNLSDINACRVALGQSEIVFSNMVFSSNAGSAGGGTSIYAWTGSTWSNSFNRSWYGACIAVCKL